MIEQVPKPRQKVVRRRVLFAVESRHRSRGVRIERDGVLGPAPLTHLAELSMSVFDRVDEPDERLGRPEVRELGEEVGKVDVMKQGDYSVSGLRHRHSVWSLLARRRDAHLLPARVRPRPAATASPRPASSRTLRNPLRPATNSNLPARPAAPTTSTLAPACPQAALPMPPRLPPAPHSAFDRPQRSRRFRASRRDDLRSDRTPSTFPPDPPAGLPARPEPAGRWILSLSNHLRR